MVYVDTSAVYALMDSNEALHPKAVSVWQRLFDGEQEPVLFMADYTLVETVALIQQRLGLEAVKSFHEGVFPCLTIEWCSEAVYRQAMAAVVSAGRKNLSLVDCAAFEVMRHLGIRQAFSFDKHFKEQGFEVLNK